MYGMGWGKRKIYIFPDLTIFREIKKAQFKDKAKDRACQF